MVNVREGETAFPTFAVLKQSLVDGNGSAYLDTSFTIPEMSRLHIMLYGSTSTWNSTPLGGFTIASTVRITSWRTPLLSD